MLQGRTIQIKFIKDEPTRSATVGNPHPKPGEKKENSIDIPTQIMRNMFIGYTAFKTVNLAFKVAEHHLIGPSF